MKTEDGRNYVTAKHVGRMFNVDLEVIAGLVRSRHVDGVITKNRKGHVITLVHPDAVARLRAMIPRDA